MTVQDAFLEYKGQIEAGAVPKTLSSAFAAGARAALEILRNPYECFLCEDKLLEIERQIESLATTNTHPKRTEARSVNEN
jgi:hypothetical protein